MRREESEVVDAMAKLVFSNCKATITPPEVVAHFFGQACHELRFIPDEASARRILNAVALRLRDACKAADDLNGAVRSFTAALRAR